MLALLTLQALAAQQVEAQAQIAALGSQLQSSQQAVTVALQALGISPDQAKCEPAAAVAGAATRKNAEASEVCGGCWGEQGKGRGAVGGVEGKLSMCNYSGRHAARHHAATTLGTTLQPL